MPHRLLTAAARGPALLPLVVMLLVTGCTPRDPLDRVVQARTLAEMKAWLDDIQKEVDPELAGEITLAFHNLAAQIPKFHPAASEHELHELGNPFCQRVNGRRLRDVMIDGYDLTITALSQQNNIDAENLLRLSAVVNTDRAEAFAARVEAVKAEIARRDAVIQHHRARIEQLRKS